MPAGSPMKSAIAGFIVLGSGLMLASRISLPKRSKSALFIARELRRRHVAGLAAEALEPLLHVRQLRGPSSSPRASRSMTGLRRAGGDEQAVPGGHLDARQPGFGERRHVGQLAASASAIITASGRTLPPLMCPIADEVVSKISWIWPPTRSVSAWLEPLYGTCIGLQCPSACANASPARCCVLPMPEEPYE